MACRVRATDGPDASHVVIFRELDISASCRYSEVEARRARAAAWCRMLSLNIRQMTVRASPPFPISEMTYMLRRVQARSALAEYLEKQPLDRYTLTCPLAVMLLCC